MSGADVPPGGMAVDSDLVDLVEAVGSDGDAARSVTVLLAAARRTDDDGSPVVPPAVAAAFAGLAPRTVAPARARGARRARRSVALGMLASLGLTGVAAASDRLPAPIQHAVASVVSHVGVELPGGDEPAAPPSPPAPVPRTDGAEPCAAGAVQAPPCSAAEPPPSTVPPVAGAPVATGAPAAGPPASTPAAPGPDGTHDPVEPPEAVDRSPGSPGGPPSEPSTASEAPSADTRSGAPEPPATVTTVAHAGCAAGQCAGRAPAGP